ncbi:MAG: extracellular solute-binding protein [Gammaproteobacteria bacterium]|nr:extracellular solute-binding protein [Gammaproteobacteria bacterium]
MTSFPEPVYSRFTKAFEAMHPDVQIFIRSKKTSAAISFIEERTSEVVDVFWASAPDAFEILKQSGSLMPAFASSKTDSRIGDYPLDDPEGFYLGFAISGYGLMWNPPYLSRHNLPEPASWQDLAKPEYAEHIGMTAPSRSGTTHLIVETILQAYGWEQGWALLSEIGGNLATITARSFGVRDGVKSGRFGIGPVVDFFGLSGKAVGAPVDFDYPDKTIFLPANVAIVQRSANPQVARAFIEFLRSDAGQKKLLEPAISRLPIRESIYQEANAEFPNPFETEILKRGISFDSQLSRRRYYLVNTLFDVLITYRNSSLRKSWSAIHQGEAQLSEQAAAETRNNIGKARQLLGAVPVSASQSRDPDITSVFSRRNPGLPVSERQRDLEIQWTNFFQKNHQEAMQLISNVLESAGRQ